MDDITGSYITVPGSQGCVTNRLRFPFRACHESLPVSPIQYVNTGLQHGAMVKPFLHGVRSCMYGGGALSSCAVTVLVPLKGNSEVPPLDHMIRLRHLV
jgi:hypothetical protein